MTNEARLKVLERHVAELAEIYDSVQVMVTWLKPDGTTSSQKRGSGDWYARQGLAHEFIDENIAEDAAVHIARKLEPPDDEWKTETANP